MAAQGAVAAFHCRQCAAAICPVAVSGQTGPKHEKSVLLENSAERFLQGKMHEQIYQTGGDRRPDQTGKQNTEKITGREAGMPQASAKIVRLSQRFDRFIHCFFRQIASLILQVLGAG